MDTGIKCLERMIFKISISSSLWQMASEPYWELRISWSIWRKRLKILVSSLKLQIICGGLVGSKKGNPVDPENIVLKWLVGQGAFGVFRIRRNDDQSPG